MLTSIVKRMFKVTNDSVIKRSSGAKSRGYFCRGEIACRKLQLQDHLLPAVSVTNHMLATMRRVQKRMILFHQSEVKLEFFVLFCVGFCWSHVLCSGACGD